MKHISTLLVSIFIFASVLSHAQPGTLDGDFDADGIILTQLSSNHDFGNSLAIQADGKILVAGSTGHDFGVARYNTDGSLDNAFSVNGMVATDFGGGGAFGGDRGRSIVLQPDGKIIVAGSAVDSEGIDFGVVRYNPDGTLDNMLDADGIVTTSFAGSSSLNEIKIQTDGKIVAVGRERDPVQGTNFAVARYNPDGTLDNSFSVDGKVTTAFGPGNDSGRALLIQPDGKIVATGTHGVETNNDEFALVRYNSDGTLDNSFGIAGKVTTAIGSGSFIGGRSVVLQADGKIVVAGDGTDEIAVLRYNSDGSLDNSFGTDGIVIKDIAGGPSRANGCAIQSDGKIVVAGYAYLNTAQENAGFVVARYLSGLTFGVVDFSIQENSLLVYPNPLQEVAVLEYTLTNSETISIDLFDISGRRVQSFIRAEKRSKGTHKESLTIDASIPSGSYILTINNGKGSSSVRVVK